MRVFQGFAILLCVCVAAAVIQPVGAAVLPDNYRLEPFARSLAEPEGAALAPDGRIFVIERVTGDVHIIQDGKLIMVPFVTLPVATNAGATETGLLGIALHPDFLHNNWVYLYYTHDLGGGSSTNRIVRYTASGNTGVDPLVILDNIGVGPNGEDNGGALAFGGDGKFYATVGVMEDDASASDFNSLGGKVLRMNPEDGSAPPDNPQAALAHPYDLIWAYGFRNSAGMAFNENVGTLYVTDNYDSEATADCDEVNVVLVNEDYGWNSLACGSTGYPPAPMQTMDPSSTCWGLAPYTGNTFPGSCSTDASRDCLSEEDCKTCDGTTDICAGDADCSTCSNRPAQGCTGDTDCMGCEDVPSDECVADVQCKACSKSGTRCMYDFDCTGGGGDKCTVQHSCVPHTCDIGTCVTNPCADPSSYMFVTGKGTGIVRDTLTGVDLDELGGSVDFYTPEGACPTGPTSLELGGDGWIYSTTAGTDPGLYRMVYDSGPEPREVSGSPYAQMTLGKDGSGLRFWWEDMKKDAWGCSDERKYCSGEILTFCTTAVDCPGGETCDLRPCPSGSGTTLYTLWKGTMGTYDSHAAWLETDGSDDGDALVTHLESSMPDPGSNLYFLVSARGNNLEGTTGYDSGDVERPGHTTTEKCDDIGWGSAYLDSELCFGEFPKAYADQDNVMRTMAEYRGQAVMISMMQYG
jgi:glucose/arabinose dehydrogenase